MYSKLEDVDKIVLTDDRFEGAALYSNMYP